MAKINTITLMEHMNRDLDSVEREIDEALQIDDAKHREMALKDLFAERDVITSFYRDMINLVMRDEKMSVGQDGDLLIS